MPDWSVSTGDEIVADINKAIASIELGSFELTGTFIVPQRTFIFMRNYLLRGQLSKRAFRRWRGKMKAAKRHA